MGLYVLMVLKKFPLNSQILGIGQFPIRCLSVHTCEYVSISVCFSIEILTGTDISYICNCHIVNFFDGNPVKKTRDVPGGCACIFNLTQCTYRYIFLNCAFITEHPYALTLIIFSRVQIHVLI